MRQCGPFIDHVNSSRHLVTTSADLESAYIFTYQPNAALPFGKVRRYIYHYGNVKRCADGDDHPTAKFDFWIVYGVSGLS